MDANDMKQKDIAEIIGSSGVTSHTPVDNARSARASRGSWVLGLGGASDPDAFPNQAMSRCRERQQ
jgi:hypothetical protein